MRLFAALVPPREVLDQVTELAAGVRAEPEPEPEPEQESVAEPLLPGRHAASSGKRFGRRRIQDAGRRPPDAAPAETTTTGPLLDLVPPVRMHVPIVKFGNLALDHAARLINAMETQASGWQSPRLHLHGGIALEPKGDSSVWVKLAGDIDELNEVVRDVFRVAQGLQLYVDRRAFRPEMQLGTVNERTTEAHLEQLLATLEAYESPSWWQVNMSMLIPIDLGPHKAPYRLHREVSLGPAVPH